MILRVLGSAGAEFPDFRPPAFLVDGRLLLDAGTVGAVLSEDEQWGIQDILITHSHLDHIRGIPNLADNIIIKNLRHSVTIHGTDDVISAMRAHLFNNIIWPDFTRIPDPESPVLCFSRIEPFSTLSIGEYEVLAVPVDHTVPAVGYIVRCAGSTLAYSGDTGPTDQFWKYASGADVLIVEVSFPNSMESLALLTRHLTCGLLAEELKKIPVLPRRILVTHPKPQHVETIRAEIATIGLDRIELLHDGAVFEF